MKKRKTYDDQFKARATLALKAASYCHLFILAILPYLLLSYGRPFLTLLLCLIFGEYYTHYIWKEGTTYNHEKHFVALTQQLVMRLIH